MSGSKPWLYARQAYGFNMFQKWPRHLYHFQALFKPCCSLYWTGWHCWHLPACLARHWFGARPSGKQVGRVFIICSSSFWCKCFCFGLAGASMVWKVLIMFEYSSVYSNLFAVATLLYRRMTEHLGFSISRLLFARRTTSKMFMAKIEL